MLEVLAIFVVLFLVVFLTVSHKKKMSVSRKKKMTLSRKSGMNGLKYSNGDTISFSDAYKNNIPSGSVFSPENPKWYFDISGLDKAGKLIFSTSWHTNTVLSQVLPKFEDIKSWQLAVASNPEFSIDSNVYEKLTLI